MMVPRILWILALCLSVGGESLSKEKLEQIEGGINTLVDIIKDVESSILRYSLSGIAKLSPYQKNSTESTKVSKPTSSTPHSTTKISKPTAQTPYSTTQPTEGDDHHMGSIPGIPGLHYPNYHDIPVTSFTCSDMNYIPGIYADMETGCQMFHICWPHRRESFLCPIGTTFNQAILTCDYWYSTNCSLAHHYYNTNEVSSQPRTDDKSVKLISMMEELLEKKRTSFETTSDKSPKGQKSDSDFKKILNFLPVKAKISVYPETEDKPPKIVAEASIGKQKKIYQHQVTKAPKITQKYTPELVTLAPKPTKFHTDKVDETTVSPKVLSDIESILDMVKLVLSDEYIPFVIKKLKAIDEAKKDKRTNRPLTKLNPKFITKPVFPKPDDRPLRVPEANDAKISLSTKKALIDNYLKMLIKRVM